MLVLDLFDDIDCDFATALGEFLEALQKRNFDLERLHGENMDLISKLYIGDAVRCFFHISRTF